MCEGLPISRREPLRRILKAGLRVAAVCALLERNRRND